MTHLSSPGQFVRAASLHGIDPVAALTMRRRYLAEQEAIFRNLYFAYNQVDPYLWWWADHAIALREVTDYMARYKRPDARQEITDDMIARARDYPIDNLIEFVRGKARAWCHDDRNPSLYHGTRHNVAVCPVCDKKFDAIAVQMHLSGDTFVQAVKNLC